MVLICFATNDTNNVLCTLANNRKCSLQLRLKKLNGRNVFVIDEIFNFKTIYNFGLVFVPQESLILEDKNQLCVSC